MFESPQHEDDTGRKYRMHLAWCGSFWCLLCGGSIPKYTFLEMRQPFIDILMAFVARPQKPLAWAHTMVVLRKFVGGHHITGLAVLHSEFFRVCADLWQRNGRRCQGTACGPAAAPAGWERTRHASCVCWHADGGWRCLEADSCSTYLFFAFATILCCSGSRRFLTPKKNMVSTVARLPMRMLATGTCRSSMTPRVSARMGM